MSQEYVEIVSEAHRRFASSGEPLWERIDSNTEIFDHDIVDAGTYRGREGVERAVGAGSGVSVERDAIVWTFRDGMLSRLDYFNDPAQALQAAGLSE